jgi:hypothetical protein
MYVCMYVFTGLIPKSLHTTIQTIELNKYPHTNFKSQ